MERRTNRIIDSSMTFRNDGFFAAEVNTAETTTAQVERNSISARNSTISNDGNSRRMIAEGIRQFATEDLSRTARTSPRHQQTQRIERTCGTKSLNAFAILLTIVLLCSPVGLSIYVFLKHKQIVTSRCSARPLFGK